LISRSKTIDKEIKFEEFQGVGTVDKKICSFSYFLSLDFETNIKKKLLSTTKSYICLLYEVEATIKA
jgi:hypothetical protein